MTAFWIVTGLATALAALLMLGGARRGAEPVTEADPGAEELAALDRLKARGLMDAAAWTAARAEAGRRILNAGRSAQTAAPRAGDRFWVLGGAGLAAAAALAVYVGVGAPGLADQPFDRRVQDWAAQPQMLDAQQLAAVVEQAVRDTPDDPQALRMLGAARFEAGDPVGAASAFRRVLALAPDDAQSWARLGESLVRANQGTVGADAEAAFTQALNRDPDQLGARYFLGEAAMARGDVARTRAMWGPLIAALDPADPRRVDLERRLPAGGV